MLTTARTQRIRDAARAPIAVLCLAILPSCAADQAARTADAGPAVPAESFASARYVSRSGVPILMDLPIIGFLFGRHVEIRGGSRGAAAVQGSPSTGRR